MSPRPRRLAYEYGIVRDVGILILSYRIVGVVLEHDVRLVFGHGVVLVLGYSIGVSSSSIAASSSVMVLSALFSSSSSVTASSLLASSSSSVTVSSLLASSSSSVTVLVYPHPRLRHRPRLRSTSSLLVSSSVSWVSCSSSVGARGC
ncbi:hypothetical protein BDZ89DRAFT_93342 [Hymenopellis radicata]|nr:hypothetical protein BDZ89DRAFT_93342 [Hymenopellis radicata]